MMSDEGAEAVPEAPAEGAAHAVVPPAPEPEPQFPAAPPPEPTGDPRVDAAVAPLGGLGGRPVHEHVEIFEDVHRRLQELLASAGQDEPAGPPQPPRPPRPAFPDTVRPRP
ncbi:hypothetical protein ABZ806_07620 [Spirillospora sp. NPDC047418]